MLIKWHGHACFEIIDSEGFSIVIDPHDGASLGLPTPSAKADVVLITHEHFDHNAYNVVLKPGGKYYSMKEGAFQVGPHSVIGLPAYHDKFKGRRRGKVVMYLLNVEGVKILHVGDLGHVLEPSEVKGINTPHVLMAPVGGTFTIDAKEALNLLELIKPKAFIPMHYWVSGINLPLAPLEHFLSLVNMEVVKVGREWKTSKEELENWVKTKVVVFSFK